MNKAAKLLVAMRQNPRDWTLTDLQTIARQRGVGWRHAGGSHCVFVAGDGRTLPVPAHRSDQAGLHPQVPGTDRGNRPMTRREDYPFEIRALSADEGGGYLITFPDFAECISDGTTVEEAVANGRAALNETIAALRARKLPVPAPHEGSKASGKFVARVPRSVHAQLARRAKAEGVSVNALVLTFIAQGLGRKEARSGDRR